MLESKLDVWIVPVEENKLKDKEAVEENEKKPTPQFEVLKEEIIGAVKVVMRKSEKLKYIEIRAYDLGPKHTIESRGFAQYLPPWTNVDVDGPKLAEEYFQALVAWFKGGRQGNILPFRYSAGPWHEEGT